MFIIMKMGFTYAVNRLDLEARGKVGFLFCYALNPLSKSSLKFNLMT